MMTNSAGTKPKNDIAESHRVTRVAVADELATSADIQKLQAQINGK